MASREHSSDRERDDVVAERIVAPRVGWIVGAEEGAVLVDFRGNGGPPRRARSTVALDPMECALRRQEALLVFDDGDPALPIVVGLVQPPATSLVDLVLADAPETPEAAEQAGPHESGASSARGGSVDGKRVVLEGDEEVVLKCGEASITLRKNGKVIIRGAYVETHAAGTNRIKGGSVRIN